VVMNLGAWLFSDRLVLALHRAREVTPAEAPRLHAIMDELCARASLPRPRVCLVDDPHANAFATGRGPKRSAVAVTTGLMALLDERELRGVLAHELAHVKNRDVLVASVAATLAAVVTHAAHALGFAAMFGGRDGDEEGGGAGGLLFLLVAPIGATLVQLGISRSREYLADETGARLSGEPLALASALEKLHRSAEVVPGRAEPATASLFIVSPIFGAGGLLRLFSTHPPPEERIRRLRALASEVRRPAFAPHAPEQLGAAPRNRLVR
jgi:heat shock protein HtpX